MKVLMVLVLDIYPNGIPLKELEQEIKDCKKDLIEEFERFHIGRMSGLEVTKTKVTKFIPNESRVFTREEMVNAIVDWDQSINPEEYVDSEEMEATDFIDAAYSKAQELKLVQPVQKAMELRGKRYQTG